MARLTTDITNHVLVHAAEYRQKLASKYRVDQNGCWIWTGQYRPHGPGGKRGCWQVRGAKMKASRMVFMLYHGEIPDGINVCHSCDVTECVNPDHLFLGSQKDNVRDCVVKGRHRSGIARVRLTDDDVQRIRLMRTVGITTMALAELFGVDHTHISRICNKRRHCDDQGSGESTRSALDDGLPLGAGGKDPVQQGAWW